MLSESQPNLNSLDDTALRFPLEHYSSKVNKECNTEIHIQDKLICTPVLKR